MAHIYNIPGSQGEIMGECANVGPNMEQKFVRSIVELVIKALAVGHEDSRIVRPLLNKALSNELNRKWEGEGLIQQYEAYVLELASAEIKNELNIPEEVKVNHSHATHAKLADIVDYIKSEDKDEFMEKFKTEKK